MRSDCSSQKLGSKHIYSLRNQTLLKNMCKTNNSVLTVSSSTSITLKFIYFFLNSHVFLYSKSKFYVILAAYDWFWKNTLIYQSIISEVESNTSHAMSVAPKVRFRVILGQFATADISLSNSVHVFEKYMYYFPSLIAQK